MQVSNQKVELVDVMGNDLSIVNAARVSFSKNSEWDVEHDDLYEKDVKLISYLARHGHWTPFAHNSISLRIKAPIFVARQLVKHQVGGVWNEVSRRYVDSEPEFYLPGYGKWRGKPLNAKQGSSEEGAKLLALYEGQEDLWGDIDNKFDPDLHALHQTYSALDLYKQMITAGIAPEQARMVLPQNTMTEWVWTGSLMFFARVYNQRIDPHAQKETQEIAKMINQIIEPLFPNGWKALTQ